MRAALRAEYQLDLRNPGVNLLDLADLVVNLPPGCALWRSMGGPMAWTREMHVLLAIQSELQTLQWQNTGIMTQKPRGEKPKSPPEGPPGMQEIEAASAKSSEKRRRRQARRSSRPGA